MTEAEKNLRECQRQLDADGVMVGVSRQAVEEVLAEVERLRSALRPFALVAEYDIGENESDVDLFFPMDARYARAPLIYVGQLRRALAVLQPKE